MGYLIVDVYDASRDKVTNDVLIECEIFINSIDGKHHYYVTIGG